jgi:hypothetical protein
MSVFLCQAKDLDGEDDWFAINTHRADWAAEEYIERCEGMSGGEMLNDPARDREYVRVKDETGTITTFEITFDYSKVFSANEVKPEAVIQ